ncbi:DUF4229 domain-containing protein [Pseudonocardia bannensis]|uniref:DUF4229 domain-containing protein n=1 Tax=Pseudonocardia bannensis TaxID=630973 RepID=A0A848DQC4_9PSEU|nr:DUF4229 domain-containing protein [Pseudonocardia bannensis]NMH95037.1 DUF4229 domain-containing protein [Pseudonocardia bannensis]
MSTSAPTPSGPSGAVVGEQPGLAATLALYTLARLGLLAVIAGFLVLAGVPLLLALLLGLIVALPLSLLLFRGMRARLDGAIAAAGRRRAAERAALRARLRGDERPGESAPSDDEAQREADGGRG